MPDKINRPANLRGFYRLMDRSEVTHRVLMDGHTAQTRRSIQALGSRAVRVREAAPHKTGRKPRPGRQGRTTLAQVAFAPVRLAPPWKRLGEYPSQALDLWAVRVWEPVTPPGEEPLEWILLTNCPVRTLEDALERILLARSTRWRQCPGTYPKSP